MMPWVTHPMINSAASVRIEKIAKLATALLGVSSAVVRLYLGRGQSYEIAVNASEPSLHHLIACHQQRDSRALMQIADLRQQTEFEALSALAKENSWRAFIALPMEDSQQQLLGCLYFIGKQPLMLTAVHLQWQEEITQLVESEVLCTWQSNVDYLTTLLNREAFIQQINQQLLQHYCAKQPCLLVFMDLNGFKKINDTYGHGEGDRALVNFAQLIKKGFRQPVVTSRFGGDEFVLFLPRANMLLGEALLTRFRKQVLQFNQQSGLPFQLDFAAGVACYDGRELPCLDTLLRDADGDMYKHKRRLQSIKSV